MRNIKFYKTVIMFLAICFISVIVSCNFWTSLTGTKENKIEITSLALGKTSLSMKVGSMDYISVTIKPQTSQKEVSLNWSYDSSIIECDTSSNWGITITALKEGQTSLRCSYNGYDAICLITVSGYSDGYESTAEPYIYSNTTVLQTSPGITEKVFVSLYGGDASDIDGYTWTLDNSNVVSIQPTGQYCLITAKESGYARIKVTNTKASYPYYIGVYVFADATNVTYITTANNILTMNTGDSSQTVTVNLVNGKDTSLDSSFQWEIVEKDSAEIPVTLEFNGNKAVITPKQSGSCTIRITHPDATYPLDILCRVITIVKNVYIRPDNTIVTMNGEEQKTISFTLENINVSEYAIDDYEYNLDDYNVAEIVNYVGNQVTVSGKANGSCKLLVSHPKSAYTREVLLIVTGLLTDAIDASCYITTSQNYIRTKVGADTTTLSISLKGGDDGDSTGFVWSVKSSPIDGISDVIKLETTNGAVNYARAASQTYSYGTAYITPNAEGTAVITVSHPKVLYPTEILVKVLSADAVLTEHLYFSGNGLIKMLNGKSYDYTVELKGKNKVSGDDENITWQAEDSRITINASANVANISAPVYGSGSSISYITISHSKCDSDKKVLVMTADDQNTLNSMKALYSDKLYYNIEVGDSAVCMASGVGFEGVYVEESDTFTPYDYSSAVWTVKNPGIVSVEKVTGMPLNAIVTGLKPGTTTVTVTLEDTSCDFTITVYPVGTVATEPEIYFTTSQNVISLSAQGKTAIVNVSAINLSSSEFSNITWKSENEHVATVIPNGTKATITATGEGTAIVNVTHKDSQNTLKIYVRVGSEYVPSETEPIVYISSNDVITILKDSQPQKLQALLVNYTETDTTGFSFRIDNEDIAKISAQSSSGIAYITPVASGQAEITISHTATEITKKVLVLVGNSKEELAGITYLTTSQNIVAVGEGNTKNISVSIKNSEEIILDGYTWISSNPSVIDVTYNGANAVLTGNSIGTAMITVSNKACKYSLTIIAQCVDPIAANSNPYIQLTSSVLTLTVSSAFTNVTADLVGGSESDYSDFIWSTNDSSICVVYGQNEVGKLRALKVGTTYITVSHPKANYTAQILVVCDEKTESECYISVPSSIISMKPTDTSQTITASLVNGSATDKYNFTWSLDVYDVIDFQYSANVCTITPKQSGSCTITISHPKASYDQQIIVNVQEYSTFSFPYTNTTITQGNVSFITMQVPTTKVTTHVEYSVDNSSICSISGTKGVVQIQAIENGTTTVRAKLIASSTGVVQAESEMMVYVKEKAIDAVYITASTTIYTVQKGKSQTLTATLSGNGITTNDNTNLTWTTSDSDIVQVTGISTDGTVKGSQIYITAVKSGEALITCSHEKAPSALQFYVVVPGTADKVVTLNKNYITLTKGSSGTTLKANIENAESSSDYYDLIWTCEDVSGSSKQIAKVMGSTNSNGEVTGQTVTVYPVSKGEARITAQLPDVKKVATCTVIVQEAKSFNFEQTSKKVQPFHSGTVKYTVSPADAILTWTTSQNDSYFEYSDLGVDTEGIGYLQINGIKEGGGTIYCVTDGGAKGTLSVKVNWDYSFNLDTYQLSGRPDKDYTINYSVSPSDANISVIDSESLFQSTIKKSGTDSGSGTITLIPKSTGNSTITIKATNPNANNAVIQSYTLKATMTYTALTITPRITKDVATNGGGTAYYSYIGDGSNAIYIGDGETITVKLNCKESKVRPVFTLNGSPTSSIVTCSLSGDTLTIKNETDYAEPCYLITEGYAPTYNGSRKYPNGTTIDPKDFTYGIVEGYYKEDWGTRIAYKFSFYNTKNSETIYTWRWPSSGEQLVSKQDTWTNSVSVGNQNDNGNWGKVRDTSLDGKCLSVEDFTSAVWYYWPVFNLSKQYSDNHAAVKHSVAEIDTNHIKAEYKEAKDNPDTSVKSTMNAGSIRIKVSDGVSLNKDIEYQIFLETRNCLCTYK